MPLSPINPDPDAGGASPLRAPVAASPRRVLVVDDDPIVLNLLCASVRKMGYTVFSAATFTEAMAKVNQDSLDALVSDVILPDGTGPALGRVVHDLHPAALVIFCSGYPRENLEARGLGFGEHPVLEKPFQRALLANLLQRHFAAAA